MSEPLYHVGQDVAVCSSLMTVVIPATKVGLVEFFRAGPAFNAETGEIRHHRDQWAYRVAGYSGLVAERCLRPINPNTEYLDTTQDQALPVDGVSA